MNTVYRERDLSSLTGDEIFNAADPAGYAGLSNADKRLVLAICSRDAINPFGANNVQAMISIFGAGTTTLSNLAALRKESISRGEELSVGILAMVDVTDARSA